METGRIRLTLEYDGTDFVGFQFQGNGRRSVQEELERALERITGSPVRVHGAGRTDAGVHAKGQVAHCDVAWRLTPEAARDALNARLPRDIAVVRVEAAPDGFHARFDATGRTYRYTVWNRPGRSALLARYAWHVADPLDLAAMRAAAAALVGTHDFAAFGSPAQAGRSTVRCLRRVDVRAWRGALLVTVEGNAFLRQMVRSLAGTLVHAGRGRLTAQRVREIRESGDRRLCPPVAPPWGLCLVRVDYDGQRPILDS